jgi:hypothetical protein
LIVKDLAEKGKKYDHACNVSRLENKGVTDAEGENCVLIVFGDNKHSTFK